MIVVDASSVFDFLLHRRDSDQIVARFVKERFALHAPSLLGLELLSSLRGHQLHRGPEPDDEEIVRDIARFPVRLHPHRNLLPRIWQLRHNITPYDAAYIALAELLDLPLLTRDRKLAKTKGHRARIELI